MAFEGQKKGVISVARIKVPNPLYDFENIGKVKVKSPCVWWAKRNFGFVTKQIHINWENSEVLTFHI